MNTDKVLFVDDDPKILKGIERQFEDTLDIQTAEGPIEGLRVVKEEGPFAVVFSDMRMPGMSGIEFLSKVQEIHSDTVRLMLTGFADLETTIDAINRGQIFRFLSKPCDNNVIKNAIEEGLRQYRLVRSEKELVEGTLMGSVKVLSEVLSLVNPAAFGRASRVKRIATAIADNMKCENIWELKIAAMLCEIGCVTLSEAVLEKLASRENLTSEELDAFKRHPEVGRSLLTNIPRLENVAEMVAYQEKLFDGKGYPFDRVKGDEIPLGARILKVALDFDIQDNLASDPFEAFANMQSKVGFYDPVVLECLENVLDKLSSLEKRSIVTEELAEGMILASDVAGQNKQLLVATGQEITGSVLKFLMNYAENNKIQEPIEVFCQSNCESELVTT